MENSLNKILGLILYSNIKDQNKIIPLINPEWFETAFQKDCFEAMKDLNSKGTFADMLVVINWLRENDKFQKDYPYKISTLTNGISMTDSYNYKTIINNCYYNFGLKRTAMTIQKLNKEITKTNPIKQNIINELEGLRTILTDSTEKVNISNTQIIESVLDRHEKAKKGVPLGIDLGWEGLRKQILLEPDDVMIVGGRPAMGKTAWAMSLIRNLVFNEGKKVVFFSLEMASDRIMRRLLSLLTGVDSNKIKYGQCSTDELNKIRTIQADKCWDNFFIFDGSHTAQDILTEVNNVTSDKEIDLIVIDYLQKITPEKTDNRYQEVTRISNQIKRMVMSKRIPCVALAQLSRDAGKTGKRPSLPDLKESGEIEQDASIVSFLHRPEYYGEMTNEEGESMENIGEFITAKNRDGSIGITEMKVDLAISSWEDFERKYNVNFDEDFVHNKTLNNFNYGDNEPF
jgi:replicative DNA helicase